MLEQNFPFDKKEIIASLMLNLYKIETFLPT